MRRITVFIQDNNQDLYLDKCVVKPKISTMILKNATIYWKYRNVITGENDEVTFGTGSSAKKITFGEGYWPFEMIKERLEADNVVLEAVRHCNKCRIQPSGGSLNLGKFGLY